MRPSPGPPVRLRYTGRASRAQAPRGPMPIDQSAPGSALPARADGAPSHQSDDTGERARELATLLDVSRAIASTLDLESLLGVITEQLRRVVGAFGVTILVRDGDEVVVIADHGSSVGRHASFVGL